MQDSHTNAWKALPYRLKALLKMDRHEDEPTHIIREFKPSKHNHKTKLIDRVLTTTTTTIMEQPIIPLKEHGSADTLTSLYSHEQLEKIHQLSIKKFRNAGDYSLEQQLHVHDILSNYDHKTNTMENLMTRRTRKNRYLIMLNSEPMVDGVHPITAFTKKARKPYKETMKVIFPQEVIPVNSLLDPTTLHANFYTRTKRGVVVEEVSEWRGGWGFLASIADWDF